MKLKIIFALFIALAFLFSITGCDKKDNLLDTREIEIDNVKHGGCKTRKETKTSENEKIYLKAISASQLKVVHYNVVFNCCPEELIVECEKDGNTLYIVEKELKPGCKCLCPYDLEFVINSLTAQTYTLKIKGYKPFDIQFNEFTDIVIFPEKENNYLTTTLFPEYFSKL